MKIRFEIDYTVAYNQQVYISGNIHGKKQELTPLNTDNGWHWWIEAEIASAGELEYSYLIKEGQRIIRKEWGKKRKLRLDVSKNYTLLDKWRDAPRHAFLYSSAFTNSFYPEKKSEYRIEYYNQSIELRLHCPYTFQNQEVVLCGESDYLGNWNSYKAIPLQKTAYGEWTVVLDASKIDKPVQYKFAIIDKTTKKLIDWEEGNNRIIYPVHYTDNHVQIQELFYNRNWVNWKSSGVAIPVFSLRTARSSGIGEFTDIIPLIDWAKKTGMQIIQILPINDTTQTHTWTDSYPYNAISIYALHPIYLGLIYPLKDKKLQTSLSQQASQLNQLKELDYQQVIALKEAYIRQYFQETGEGILASEEYKTFYRKNEEWLFPYACFCYLRDKHNTSDYTQWKENNRCNLKELNKSCITDKEMKAGVELVFFTQYLLHTQLSEAKKYAHKNGIVLKGDIPIGVSHNSVETWLNPRLFYMDSQAGAPPDPFSILGQNWGFPTYNWKEMSKDGYSWWVKRFQKMTDYFDVYRIDHILGFFRIWEIPFHSVQGLLGYFNPALPYTVQEIEAGGLKFDENRMVKPYITKAHISENLGGDTEEFINKFLNQITPERYELKEFVDKQLKIKTFFADKTDIKNSRFKEYLYTLCNEVLFIRDKYEIDKFHPRIIAQYGNSYKDLTEEEKNAYNPLYDNFFFHRHNEFWKEEAIKKLPTLINSTDMLVCGEDLGMIPDTVPAVMNELQILRLEIERMPKNIHEKFENLSKIPYLSVCTTSTHDMSPIRAWWHEDKSITQQYFNEILWKQGEAPDDCTPEICWQILTNHLNSPAMLTIIPLQDWLSLSEKLRRENPYEERINIPAVEQHDWRYRMHLNIEELIEAEDLNKKINDMLKNSDRLSS